jgi:hypothetical protein
MSKFGDNLAETGLPLDMRKPRQCRNKGWFYINPASIDVYTSVSNVSGVRLTRKQLESALKAMDRYHTGE